MEYKLHAQQWGNTANESRYYATFTENMMEWVNPIAVTITSGDISNRKKCMLELDLNAYCTAYHTMLLAEASGDNDEEKGSGDDDVTGSENGSEDKSDKDGKNSTNKYDTVVNSSSLNNVLGRLPMFLNTKSMLEEELERNGHILILSEKYHAECAGQVIEYCFERCKCMVPCLASAVTLARGPRPWRGFAHGPFNNTATCPI